MTAKEWVAYISLAHWTVQSLHNARSTSSIMERLHTGHTAFSRIQRWLLPICPHLYATIGIVSARKHNTGIGSAREPEVELSGAWKEWFVPSRREKWWKWVYFRGHCSVHAAKMRSCVYWPLGGLWKMHCAWNKLHWTLLFLSVQLAESFHYCTCRREVLSWLC